MVGNLNQFSPPLYSYEIVPLLIILFTFVVVSSPSVSRQTSFVGPNAAPLPPIGSTGAVWTCQHCTFINQPDTAACEMCSLPKA